MSDKMRTTVPLVAALALTASAVLAGNGAAMAGKPAPDLGDPSYRCEPSPLVWWNLSANKGRWLHLLTQYKEVGSTTWQPLLASQPTRVETATLNLAVSSAVAEVRILATNKKGASLTEPEEWSVATLPCG